MKFIEIENSPYKPFQDFISVRKAKELDFIPKQYHEVFLDDCACGSERMARLSNVDGAVTGVTCCDPLCHIKLAYQLALIFERFGYKGLGKETCAKVVQDFLEHGKPFGLSDILLHGEGIISLSGAIGERWAEAMEHIRASKQSFGAMIHKLSFPGLGSKFEDIMHGISSMAELAAVIKKETLLHFFSKRGVKSMTTIWYFIQYLPEIDKLTKALPQCITISLEKVLPICMTGWMYSSLGKFKKEEFLNLCARYLEERKLEQQFELKSVDSVAKATFIIAGADSIAGNSSKYKQAVKKQTQLCAEKGSDDYKILFSPDEFLYFILGKG